MKRLLYNILIITQNPRREIIRRGFIVFNEDLIEQVEAGDYLGDGAEIDLRIDGADLMVTPGLINVHVHLGETIYQDFLPADFSLEEYLSITNDLSKRSPMIEAARTVVAEYSALQLLKSGTSTIAGGRVSQSSSRLGLRNISGYMIMNSHKLQGLTQNIFEKFTAEVLASSHDSLTKLATFVHSLSFVGQSEITAVKKVAEFFPDRILMLHAAETKQQEEKVCQVFGRGSIAVLSDENLLNDQALIVHGNWLTPQELGMIKKAGSSIAHCLSSNLKVADRVLDIDQAMKIGVNVCLATDGVCTAGTFSVLEEARRVYQRALKLGQHHVSPQRVFDMITVDAARAIGLQDQTGSIEVGKKADLAIWSESNFSEKVGILEGILRAEKDLDLKSLIIDGNFIIWYKKLLINNELEIINKYRTLKIELKNRENENCSSKSTFPDL